VLELSYIGDEPIQFIESLADFGSDLDVYYLTYKASDRFGGFDSVLLGLGVVIHVALTHGEQGRLHECRTDLQFGMEKLNKIVLCLGA